MNPFTYTPTDKRAAAFAIKNAQVKERHDATQLSKLAEDRTAYEVTDEDFAHAALDRVGDSYASQILEESLVANRPLFEDALNFLSDEQKAAIVQQVEAAKQA